MSWALNDLFRNIEDKTPYEILSPTNTLMGIHNLSGRSRALLVHLGISDLTT